MTTLTQDIMAIHPKISGVDIDALLDAYIAAEGCNLTLPEFAEACVQAWLCEEGCLPTWISLWLNMEV